MRRRWKRSSSASDGIASSPSRVKLLIDSSTIHPDSAREIGRRLHGEHGIRFVDAPVSGGAIGARLGTLAAMIGGSAEDVERAKPFVRTFAERFTHMGPLGAGQAAKACNQIINGVTPGRHRRVVRAGRPARP